MQATWLPSLGDVLWLDEAASVQFAGRSAVALRVIRVHNERTTYDGWVWIDGYALDNRGEAIERREVFVRLAGLRPANTGRFRTRHTR